MHARPPSKIHQAFVEGTPIDRALMRAAKKADILQRKLGLPVPIWVNGRVVWDPSPPLPVRRKRKTARKPVVRKKTGLRKAASRRKTIRKKAG
jgi:hypothetical protein